jgi:hypothetical protein
MPAAISAPLARRHSPSENSSISGRIRTGVASLGLTLFKLGEAMAEGGPRASPRKYGIRRLLVALLAIPAAVVGAYAGRNLLLPIVAAGIISLVLWKAKLIEDKLLIQAISVQGGHAAWMLLGLLLTGAGFAFQIEILAYGAAVVVFALHPRRWTTIILLAYQAITILINILNLTEVPVGDEISRALAAHVSFRAAAIVLLIMLLRRGLVLPSPGKITTVFE